MLTNYFTHTKIYTVILFRVHFLRLFSPIILLQRPDIFKADEDAMITIEEKKFVNDTYYIRTISNDGISDYVSTIHVRAVAVQKDGRTYYMLYNSKMEVCSEAFAYINGFIADKSQNTRIKAHEALKFLTCFEEITGKRLQDFNASDISNLKYFLHGYSPEGQNLRLVLSTVRANDTVNGYLSVYRGYLDFLGIKDHALFKTTGRIKLFPASHENVPMASASYRSNDRSPKQFVEVPKYISVDEFIKILEYVRKNCSLMEEIIIRLMYQCGLRIGEVLGLTADDLVMERLEDGNYSPVAYIRNRVTDKEYQNAKTCMKVISRKQYLTSEYNTPDYGYQYVPVPQDLFDLINDYIEEFHVAAREGKNTKDRYYSRTIADRVRESEEYEDENYYIFINSIGTPLSASTWNEGLRKIFEAVGIPVDRNKRRSNLNHRFRHGFAMFNVIYCGMQDVELAGLLRHGSIESVLCYYNPTISDQIKLKTEFANSLYDIIPELRRE